MANLRFALTVEPNNLAAKLHLAWCETQRAAGLATLPSTLSRELQINPFMRCSEDAAIRAAQQQSGQRLEDAAQVLGVLRQWKNNC